MKTITGHLTATDKKHIKTILINKWSFAKSGLKTYYISQHDNLYTVKIEQRDRGLIPVAGSKLRVSTYISTFKL